MTNVAEMMKNHLMNIKLMKGKITDFSNSKSVLRNKAIETDLNMALSSEAWSRLLSSQNLVEIFKKFSFKDEEAELLLEYPFLKGLSDSEWEIIWNNKESYFSRLLQIKEKTPDFLKSWNVPFVLHSFKKDMNDESFEEIKNHLVSERKHGFTESYDDAAKVWENHVVVNTAISIFTNSHFPLKGIKGIFERLNLLHKEQELIALAEVFDILSVPLKSNRYKNENFLKGFFKISSFLKEDFLKAYLNENPEKAFNDILKIGEIVYVDLTEKMLRKIIRNDDAENIPTVLFGNYKELVDKIFKIYEPFKNINWHSNEWDKALSLERALVLFQRAIFDNKKAFLKLLQETDLKFQYAKNSALLSEVFYRLVNVNTLNKETLKKAYSMNVNRFEERFKENFKGEKAILTFQEFEFLTESHDLQIELFFLLKDWKVDQKMRTLKTIPYIDWKSEYKVSREEFINLIISSLEEKAFHQYTNWMKEKNVTKKGAFLIQIFKNKFKNFLDDIQTDLDVDLLLTYELLEGESLLSFKERIYKDNETINSFKNFLEASEDFVQNNKSRFYDFYEKGLMNVALVYKSALNQQQRKNLQLLTKAEIAGKLKDVKYRDEDFEKEIGIFVEQPQKQQWKKDTYIEKGKYLVSETSDFNHLIRMGEIPTTTCMNWNTGSYRSCLLSIFDLNKKMIVVEKQGKVVARAILRLTKVNEFANKANTDLGFVDVENMRNESKETLENKKFQGESLVLFLERFYTSITGEERNRMEKDVISLIMKKAEEMNISLILSEGYKNVSPDKTIYLDNLPIFISRSKNGKQYIDSLGGESDSSDGGSYHKASVLLVPTK